MQRGASISYFFNPSKLKRMIFVPSQNRADGRPAAWSSVARALFCTSCLRMVVQTIAFTCSPARAPDERFVYLTLWDRGREGSLRAAVLHAQASAWYGQDLALE